MTGIAEPIVNGFVLGISAGPLCFTGCFPMLFSITLADAQKHCRPAETWLFIGKFISGRFIAYLGFGLLVGSLGSQLGAWNHKIGIYASLVLAFLLVAYGMGVRMPHLGLCSVAGSSTGNRYFPVILGGLSGLNLCPPFLLAITCTLQNSVTPAFGIAFFMSFFVATSLFIAPAGLSRYIAHRELIVRLGRIATVAVGIVFFYQGVSALLNWN
jgi:hypothetical protein